MTQHGHSPEGPGSQVLLLRFGIDHLAIPLLAVREVLRVQPITPVPGAANWILGVLMRQGSLYPVVDIRSFLGFAPAIDPRPHRIVLIQHPEHPFALATDGVLDIFTVADAEVQAVPSHLPADHSALSMGLIQHQQQPVFLLHVEGLVKRLRESA